MTAETAPICRWCRNRVIRLGDAWWHAPTHPLPDWSVAAAQLDEDHQAEPDDGPQDAGAA